jgi:hypothetical protein
LTTTNKDFKVKNGIAVTGSGTVGGPVVVGTPTDPDHAVTKQYLDDVAAATGLEELDGGTPTTDAWGFVVDGGTP